LPCFSGQEVPLVRLTLAGVSKHFGARTLFEDVQLTLGPRSRVGVVGANGAGKTTLLRLLAGLEAPDTGRLLRSPARLMVGYLAQESDVAAGEAVLDYLRRRTGVAAAQASLEGAAEALARGDDVSDEYAAALERFLALGGGDLQTRARAVCVELGLGATLERPARALSGGESARLALAALLLARFEVLLADEPTNDLDFDGLERLERFLDGYPGALVVVSHDRAFLDRVVTRIVSLEPGGRGVREWAGGWSTYAAARDAERTSAYTRFEQAQERRAELTALLARRRTEARAGGAAADRRGTHALMTKVRQAERLLERNELPVKPFEPWELQLGFTAGARPGDLVARLEAAVAERGGFRLGPVDLDLAPGERLAVTGPNGSGKSTLLGLLTGDLPLAAGRRVVGRRTVLGSLEQGRPAYASAKPLLAVFCRRSGLADEDARTLLAKFGLGADEVHRACTSLSPGERTRAQLAELQHRGVNLLVLDEPTNHLDLEAIEQLEQALAAFDGTLVVVSHDRRFLEAVAPTRELALA
jgi:ATPase subunit of ABC transporter with duplicated ATPase domains